MQKTKSFRWISTILFLSTLAFQTGELVELNRMLNARKTLQFAGSSNIAFTVQAGTVGSVLDYKKLPSGNYGLQIRLEGSKWSHLSEEKRTVWVYDWKNQSDDIRACKNEACTQIAKSLDVATHAQVLRQQQGLQERPLPTSGRWSERNDSADTAASVNTCSGWNCQSAPAPAQQVERIQEQLTPASINQITEQLTGRLTFSGGTPTIARCNNIMSNDGTIGEYGQLLLNAMKRSKYGVGENNIFLKANAGQVTGRNILPLCPKFNQLDTDSKWKVRLRMWAALGDEESDCNPNVPHGQFATVNGRRVRLNPKAGWGMFAAELHAADRNWRGSDCQGNIKDVRVQITCAVDTVARVNGQYFGPLNRYKTQILPKMKRIKECF